MFLKGKLLLFKNKVGYITIFAAIEMLLTL